MNFFKHIVLLLGLLSTHGFFQLASLVGFEYKGLGDSYVYVIYIVIIFVLNLSFYLNSLIKFNICKADWLFFISLFFYVSMHLLWYFFDLVKYPFFSDSLNFFILLGLPGLFAALVIIKQNSLVYFIKCSDFYLALSIISLLNAAFKSSADVLDQASLAGATYQFLSYSGLLSFILISFNTFIFPQENRFKIFKTKFMKLYFVFGLFVCVFVVLLGGGKGAFALLLFFLLKFSFAISKKVNFIKISFLFFSLVLIASQIDFNQSEKLVSGYERATSIFSVDVQNTSSVSDTTSGRDDVYAYVIDAIYKSPFYGYGPFYVFNKVDQPHNVLLEIILQFGFFIGLPIIFFIIKVVFSTFFTAVGDISLTKNLLLFSFFSLMVGGSSYLTSSIFLFSFFYNYAAINGDLKRYIKLQ